MYIHQKLICDSVSEILNYYYKHFMQTEQTKALYQKLSKRLNQKSQSIQFKQLQNKMESSNHSLYKILQKNYSPKINHSQENNLQRSSLLKQTTNQAKTFETVDRLNQNYVEKFENNISNDCRVHKKQSLQFEKEQNKLQKPSTPTYHAQSSLNFLKHRKKQILLNQSMGLTLKNLQQQKKSRDKSKEDQIKSTSSSKIKNNKLNSQNSFVGLNRIKVLKDQSKSKSISKLQKIEAAIEQFHVKTGGNKRNFLRNSRIDSKSQFDRNSSLSNSKRSVQSVRSIASSKSSFQSDFSRPRTQILSDIASKLTQSRLLKTIQQDKERRNKKQAKAKQNNLNKRLNTLQQLINNIEIKRAQSNQIKKVNEKKREDFQVIYKLRNQLDLLNQELNCLSNKNQKKIQTTRFKSHFNQLYDSKKSLNQPIVKYQFQKNFPSNQSNPANANRSNFVSNQSNPANRQNFHFHSSFISQMKNNKVTSNSINQQSPLKITFNYQGIRTNQNVIANNNNFNVIQKQRFNQEKRISEVPVINYTSYLPNSGNQLPLQNQSYQHCGFPISSNYACSKQQYPFSYHQNNSSLYNLNSNQSSNFHTIHRHTLERKGSPIKLNQNQFYQTYQKNRNFY